MTSVMVRAHGSYSHAHLKAIGPESKNKAMGACTSLGFNGVCGSGGRSFFVELNPMKRNMQLIQVILAHIESGTIETFLENCEEEAQWAEGQSLDEHLLESQKKEETAQIVLEHLWLCEDAGLVADIGVTTGSGLGFVWSHGARPRLTNAGHDLLGALRSKGVMEKLKQISADKRIDLTLQALKLLIPEIICRLGGG